jgi:hypothetical protein
LTLIYCESTIGLTNEQRRSVQVSFHGQRILSSKLQEQVQVQWELFFGTECPDNHIRLRDADYEQSHRERSDRTEHKNLEKMLII